MTTYIQQWIVAGSDHSPEALTARRQVYEALVQRKVDQLRFDQALYFASVHGSWLNEWNSKSQLTQAEAEGKHELVARIVESQRRRRISYGGWRLAMQAAHVNLRLSIDGFGKGINDLYRKDAYALDTLDSRHIRAFLEEEEAGSEGFDELNRPFSYHMDSHRLQSVNREGVENRDVSAIEETYQQWLNGTLTDFAGGFYVAATTFTFVSWRACEQPLVGVHLLAPFAGLLRRYTKHGPDNPRSRIPEDVEHGYGMINEPQHQERVAQLEAGSNWDAKVMQPFVALHHDRRRSYFIEKVDEMQAFVRDLTAFNEQLLAFIALHRSASGVEGLTHPFEKLAAQYNLIAALSVSSDVTRKIQELRELLVRKYLPRADRIRPLLQKSVHQVDERYVAALDGLAAFYKGDDCDAATRAGLALIDSELARFVTK